jgi:hypothetical protein
MTEKRVYSRGHPAPVRRGRRFIEVRMKGSLWRHSSFNLVEPRRVAPPVALIPRRPPGLTIELASQSPRRNLRSRTNPGDYLTLFL